MSLTINLLGKPFVERDGSPVPSPRGRKAWALLVYLLRTERPPQRDELVSLLFAEADDPFRALRWNLTELRRLLGGCVSLSSDSVEVTLPAGTLVDLQVMTRGTWAAALGLPGLGRDLLEGMDFSASAPFEAWLLNERRHLRASTEAVLREAALALGAAGDHERAIDAATRLVTLDPLNEAHQAVLVRSYAAAGDRAAALAQLASCGELLQRELGVDPGPEVAAALDLSPASSTAPAAGGRAAAVAQLEAGEAAVKAGSWDAGVECLRRAVAEAHSSGDTWLKARTLLGLGSALAHSGRGIFEEGAAALHEAVELADRLGDREVCVQAWLDLAWMEFLGARYDRCQVWLELVREGAEEAAARAYFAWLYGKVLTETARYPDALEWLQAAPELAATAGDGRLRAFAQASLGRAYLLIGDFEPARETLEASAAGFRAAGWTPLISCPESFRSEVLLLQGRPEEAAEAAEFAFALAVEVKDPTLETLAERSLGLVALHRREVERGMKHLQEAHLRLVRTPDYAWAMAYALEALCAAAVREGDPSASAWVQDLEAIAGRSEMRELLARSYLHRHALGDPDALTVARNLAAQIENPALAAAIPADAVAVS